MRSTPKHKINLLQSVDKLPFSGNGKHLDKGFLSMIAAVLGTTLTLGYPHRLPLLQNAVVDIGREFLGSSKTLSQSGVALHDEGSC